MVSIRRILRRLFCAGTCALVACVQAFAQTVPADSVMFDSVMVTAGQPARLMARLYNTHTLVSLSLPLAYAASNLTLDSVSWVSSRADCAANGSWEADSATGRVLMAITALEAPYVAPGRGVLATFHFSTNPQAPDSSQSVLDTAFLVPNSPVIARDPDRHDLPLFFAAGVITLREPNLAPVLEVDAQQSVNEGELLEFAVRVSDHNHDPVVVSAEGAPTSAVFSPAGEGEYVFSWTPEFVGSMSSSAGPFLVTFHATDGELTASQTVEIHVGNVNRRPELALPPPVTVNARDTARITIEGVDPDVDPLTLTCLDALDRDTIAGSNPWTYSWVTTNADVGLWSIRLVCADNQGGADTVVVSVTVAAVVDHRLTIETTEGVSGQIVSVNLALFTRDSIGGADLLIHYDPTVLTFDGIDRAGGGTESWELFDVSSVDDPGGKSIHVVGIADMPDGVLAPALPPSDTVLFTFTFLLSDEPQFHNQSIPVTFNLALATDNVLSDAKSTLITQDQIEYVAGAVLITPPAGFLIGDINLNGVAFEVGDAVRLTNYFIYGPRAALDPVQTVNADCNQDGMKATLSDLVYLIRVLVEEIQP